MSIATSPAPALRETGSLAPAGRLLLALALAALVAAPWLFYPAFLIKILCFALFAAAFNLLLGYVGLLSFGHAAFFGGAAYITAHTVKEWGFTPELGILAGVLFSAALGLAMGFLAIRRQGIYFAMVTLALSQMVYFVFLQAPFTHSEDGIQAVPQGMLFGLIDLSQPLPLYYTVLAAFLIGMVVIWRVVNSPFGNILAAIRENEPRAISLGYEVDRYKLTAFVMSAALAGLAGAIKAIAFQLATLVDVTWQMSGEVVLMTLLGGMGTLLGPVVGAALVTAMEHYLGATSIPAPVLIGGSFVACVMLFRRGIVGEIQHRLSARTSR